MTVEEAKQRKRTVEQSILLLLQEYQREYGVDVSGIYLSKRQKLIQENDSIETVTAVNLWVKL